MGRRAVVYGLLALVVGGHLYDIAVQREHWPFSPYPMFASDGGANEVTYVVPVGVSDEPNPREIPLNKPAYFAPYPLVSLLEAFRFGEDSAKAGSPALRDALAADYLSLYESRRREGLHDGPPLKRLLVYVRTWRLDASLTNQRRPDRETLVFAKEQVPPARERP